MLSCTGTVGPCVACDWQLGWLQQFLLDMHSADAELASHAGAVRLHVY